MKFFREKLIISKILHLYLHRDYNINIFKL
nr:MAG TPA: hypothetical protein [Caudoviricetes sp.]